jgi:FeS assembly SUF system regulator
MLKISKLTDYGLLSIVYLTQKLGQTVSAREIAGFYDLPLPVVSKVLKALQEGGVVQSQRGVSGGYSLQRDPESITLGDLLEILEGPWDLIECEVVDVEGHAVCSIRKRCQSRSFMSSINRTIKSAFENITLADLARGEQPSVTWQRSASANAGTGRHTHE